jgi:hypothetical protein
MSSIPNSLIRFQDAILSSDPSYVCYDDESRECDRGDKCLIIKACPIRIGLVKADHVGAGLRPVPIRLKNDQLPDYREDDR